MVISEDFAGLIKFKAWWSGAKFARISMTNIADKIRLPGRTVKEDLIHFRVVKARHRTAIKPKGTSGNDEIGALQGEHVDVPRLDVRSGGGPSRGGQHALQNLPRHSLVFESAHRPSACDCFVYVHDCLLTVGLRFVQTHAVSTPRGPVPNEKRRRRPPH